MMSDEAAEKASHAPSTSFTVDLHKWKTVMGAYRDGGHMYHATVSYTHLTLPTKA